MKKIFAFVFAAAAMTIACSKEELNSTGEDSRTCTISAYVSEDGGTKVAVQDNGTYISHIWKTGDAIAVFDGTEKKVFTLSVGAETSKGTFNGETLTGTAPFYAIYPNVDDASISEGVITTEFKATQTYTAGSYDKDAVVMVASTEDITEPLPFKLASSFIEITLTPATAYTVKKVEVTSNGGEIIAGTGEVSYNSGTPTVNMTSGVPTVAVDFGTEGLAMTAGTSYTFYVALPAVSLASGVSVAITGSDNKMILKKSSTLSLSRNTATEMPALTAVPSIINLSLANSAAVGLTTPETANCYVVNEAGTYAIPVDVRGNEETPTLFGLTSVEEVWDENDKVGSEKLYGKYITFKTEGDGNALVAVKKGDDIVWSWHIWETSYVLGEDDVTFTKGKMMPVTIGAYKTVEFESNTYFNDNKIVFQYGRKDPFLAIKGKYSTTSASRATVSESIKAPNVFVSNQVGWCSDYNLNWNTTKTIYDPSPVGYKITSNALRNEISAKTKEEVGTIGYNFGGLFLPNTYTFIKMESGKPQSTLAPEWVWVGIAQSSDTGVSLSTSFGAGHGLNVLCMRAPK